MVHIECVCHVSRKTDERFGGLQVIIIDFKQLKPVQNYCYGDSGDYVFESPNF